MWLEWERRGAQKISNEQNEFTKKHLQVERMKERGRENESERDEGRMSK